MMKINKAIRDSGFGIQARKHKRGAAIIIVLSFIVLLTGIILSLFIRSLGNLKLSESNAEMIKADLLAQGAVETILGDLKQEIVDGSGTPTIFADGSKLYLPSAAAQMVPQRVGTDDDLPNLIKRSADNVEFYTGGIKRASSVSTSDDPSLNGREVSKVRWNKAFLLPKDDPDEDFDATPDSAFTAPDWIFVARDGSNPTSFSGSLQAKGSNPVLGRYAYCIYDEGGLLDANVAGYPSSSTPAQAASKVGLAYADLSLIFEEAGFDQNRADQIVDQMVGWRNYASAAYDLTQDPPVKTGELGGAFPEWIWNAQQANNFFISIFSNTKGFFSAANAGLANGQSDRQFSSRQELMKFLLQGVAIDDDEQAKMQVALQYLATYTRDLNQPFYRHAVQTDNRAPRVLNAGLGGNIATGLDTFINPSFPHVRVPAAFTRNDGNPAKVGEPLVKKRFALNRLAWITYQGPSASRNQSDPDIQALINNGITWDYLQLGTAVNIQNYFGLTWDGSENRWEYNVHRGTSGPYRIIKLVGRPANVAAANANRYVQDSGREPDFFELLKAGITLGSLGKAATATANTASNPPTYGAEKVPLNYRYNLDTSVDYHIIQIGANILNEVNPTSYPIRIAFDDGSPRGLWEFQGVTDLPYLQYVFNGVLRTQAPVPGPTTAADNSPFQYPLVLPNPGAPAPVTLTDPGNAYMIQVPAVWNPYDPNGTPGVLRPSQFRIVIDSNDPLSPSGSGNLNIWHGAVASTRTAYGGGTQAGLIPNPAVYSYAVSGLGKTTENPTGNGTPIFDAVKFNDGNGALYREPTVIFKAQNAATGNATRVNALTNPTPGNALPAPGDISSLTTNPLPGETDNSTGPWAPLVLGQFPLAFAKDSTNTTIYYSGTGLIGLATGSGDNRVYFTYRLQYQDPNNASNWITYDTKYGRTTHGLFAFQGDLNGATTRFNPCVIKGPQRGDFSPYSWASAIDPRSARFGLITNVINVHFSQAWNAYAPQWWLYDSSGSPTVATDGILPPIRPDNARGFFFANFDISNAPPGSGTSGNANLPGINTRDVPFPGYPDPANPNNNPGWTAPVIHMSVDGWMFAPGMYAQNNPGAPFYEGGSSNNIQPSYYADADGVVRRGAGAYVPAGNGVSASTSVGLPPASINGYSGQPASLVTPASATPFTQSQSRPLLLHRPFRSVAELGYVFRDLPWKNLDFFTPESGDAALLDLFCIQEADDPQSLIAGKVNLNTRQVPVLAAVVAGACVDDPKVSNTTIGLLSSTVANAIATALTARTADTTANYGPLLNPAELVGKWQSAAACTPPAGVGYSPTNSAKKWGIDLPLTSGYKDGKLSYTGFSGNTVTTSGKDLSSVFTSANAGTLMESLAYVKRLREAPIRALANVGQTRVWNVMIDVVAQTGLYSQSATALDQFVVEGEQRYWVHVAIDRLTGQIIDKQIEVVKE